MFGYVIVNKGDLTFREFDVYHSYYCGLCKTLKEKYGVLGQLALNYDMTFLVMLLSSLYEPQTDYTREGCVTHLFMKQGISKNEITQFGADMTILLTAYKCEDDWQDEKKLSRKLYESALHGRMSKVKEKYRDKAEIIEVCFANLHRLEQENCDKPDKMAAIFGKVMEELFVYREDEWEETLRSMGFYLGKYIYLLDAYEDLEKDKKQKKNKRDILSNIRIKRIKRKKRGIYIEFTKVKKATKYEIQWSTTKTFKKPKTITLKKNKYLLKCKKKKLYFRIRARRGKKKGKWTKKIKER